jgi:hypothetical protein
MTPQIIKSILYRHAIYPLNETEDPQNFLGLLTIHRGKKISDWTGALLGMIEFYGSGHTKMLTHTLTLGKIEGKEKEGVYGHPIPLD